MRAVTISGADAPAARDAAGRGFSSGLWRALGAALLLGGVGAPAAAQTEAAPLDCAKPACEATISPRCLARVGAGALPAAGDDCEAGYDAYVRCLTRVAETCGGAAPQAAPGGAAPQAGAGACPREDARAEWARLRDSRDRAALAAFAEACADTLQGRLAAARLETLKAEPAPKQPIAGAIKRAVTGRAPSAGPVGRVVGAIGPLQITEDRGCALPEDRTFALGAWRLQVAPGSRFLKSRYLILASAARSDRFAFVGVEVLETSNGWFRYRAPDRGVTVMRKGTERPGRVAVKTTPPLTPAEKACSHYRWGRFDLEITPTEIRLAYDGRDNLYANEVARFDPSTAARFTFRGEPRALE